MDKPAGWTSHDVVARMRKIYGLRRVGHAGTLDPDATGVLLVGLGRATRLLRFLTETGKVYRGEVAFGVATDTLDAAGTETARAAMPAVTADQLEAVIPRFLGTIDQIPPMVSAIKVDGRRLHELARQGEVVERAPRPVRIDRIEVEAFSAGEYPPGPAAGRVRQRHLHPEPRRRPRGGPRGLRPPGLAASPAGRPLPGRGGPHPRGDRRLPREGPAAAGRGGPAPDPRRRRRGDRPGRLPRRGLPGHRPRREPTPGRWPSSAPTAGSSPSTRRAGRRPGRSWSSTGGLSGPMHVVTSLDACPDPPAGSVVTIGAFDGVHLGHQALLRLVREQAAERGLPPPSSPSTVTRPRSCGRVGPQAPDRPGPEAGAARGDRPRRPRRRPHLRRDPPPGVGRGLRHRGPRRLPPAPGWWWSAPTSTSGTAAAATWPCWSGWAATSASRSSGSTSSAPNDGRDAKTPVTYSSTLVRQRLARRRRAGRGRDPGPGPRGAGHGGRRGPPGPRAGLPDRQRRRPGGDLPPGGGHLRRHLHRRPTAWPGRRPSPSAAARPSTPTRPYLLLEAYLLDFSGDLYGQPASVGFVDRIRSEERFDSVEALVEAMHRDVEAARRLLEPGAGARA